MDPTEQLAGEPARSTGEYEELNVFGAPTGWSVHRREGERLPPLPWGFTWRRMKPDDY